MSIWRSAFLHEFPKGNPRNYLSPPGTLNIQDAGGVSAFAPPDGFLINPSRWLQYEFEERFERVIGIDITLRGTAFIPIFLIFPPKPSPYFQIASLGNGLVKLHIGVEGTSNAGRVKLEIGGQSIAFEDLTVPNSFGQIPFKLRARWHTTGQVHVWWNDELIAYEPQMAAGNSFPIGDVAIGAPTEAGTGFLPSMDVTYFYTKVLRENDAEIKLGQEIELDGDYLDPNDPCWARIEKLQLDVIEAYRRLMGSVVEKLTQSWRNKDSGQPFSQKSVQAHASAKAAFAAFLLFLRDRDAKNRDEYLLRIEEFLRIVAETEPEKFVETLNLVQQHDASIPEECKKKMELVFSQNMEQLTDIRLLMDETMAIINKIAGVA